MNFHNYVTKFLEKAMESKTIGKSRKRSDLKGQFTSESKVNMFSLACAAIILLSYYLLPSRLLVSYWVLEILSVENSAFSWV